MKHIIDKAHLESIESDFNSGIYYEYQLLGFGRNAPIYKIVFEVIENYDGQFSYHEEKTYYCVDVETWSFDSDTDDISFDDFKDDIVKVKKQKTVKHEWVETE